MDCKVCLDKFNGENKRPRYIPCGHTFCSFCLGNLLKNSTLNCPSCRAPHNASEVEQFPIAYLVEELLKECSAKSTDDLQSHASTANADDSSAARKNNISKKLSALKEEERASLRNVDFTFREMLAEMARYKADIAKWDQEHEQLQDQFNRLIVEPNEEVRRLLSEEVAALEDMCRKGEGQQILLRNAAKGLSVTETAQEVVSAIDDADQRLVEAEDWIQDSRKRFPNITAIYKSIRLRMMMKNALDALSSDSSSGFIPLHLSNMNSSLLQKVHLIGELAPVKITLGSLQRREWPVRSLVEAGVVFAVKKEEDQSRFARISMRDDKVFLHHLNACVPPPNSYIVQYNDIKDAMSNSNILAFLELSWPAAYQRQRVHIRLFPDTARGRQFAIICTGELGPSFAKTKFQKVINKGAPGELLMGGSYSCVKGTTLMPTGDRYKRKALSGVVCGIPHGDKGWDARYYGVFHVATRDNPGFFYNTAFGHVEKGLEVLAAAATLSDVSRVEVVDSGLVL